MAIKVILTGVGVITIVIGGILIALPWAKIPGVWYFIEFLIQTGFCILTGSEMILFGAGEQTDTSNTSSKTGKESKSRHTTMGSKTNTMTQDQDIEMNKQEDTKKKSSVSDKSSSSSDEESSEHESEKGKDTGEVAVATADE